MSEAHRYNWLIKLIVCHFWERGESKKISVPLFWKISDQELILKSAQQMPQVGNI